MYSVKNDTNFHKKSFAENTLLWLYSVCILEYYYQVLVLKNNNKIYWK